MLNTIGISSYACVTIRPPIEVYIYTTYIAKVYIHEIKGKVLTTGDPLNMIKTTLHFALKDPELSKTVKEFLKTIGE